MADFATLERQNEMQTASARQMTAEEAEHCSRIAENYRKLILEGATNLYRDAAVAEPPAQAEPQASPAAQRIADYYTVAPDPARHALFENYTYREGELVEEPTDRVVSAPVAAPAAPAAANDEDAVPTRRTMDTLRGGMHKAEAAPEQSAVAKPAFFASLSPKVRLALFAVFATVIAAVILVIVNAVVLRSLNNSIAQSRIELTQLSARSEEVYGQIDSIVSDENVDAWAMANEMFRS